MPLNIVGINEFVFSALIELVSYKAAFTILFNDINTWGHLIKRGGTYLERPVSSMYIVVKMLKPQPQNECQYNGHTHLLLVPTNKCVVPGWFWHQDVHLRLWEVVHLWDSAWMSEVVWHFLPCGI